MLRWALSWSSHLVISEPIVPRRVWVPLMKLPEFLQTAYREVVEWFLRPVFSLWIVEPSDEVEDPFAVLS